MGSSPHKAFFLPPSLGTAPSFRNSNSYLPRLDESSFRATTRLRHSLFSQHHSRGRQHCWLTAAIALRRAGHEVAIYEASGFQNEASAALCLPPNAPHRFLAWGIDPDALRFAVPDVNSKLDGFIA
jgi:hypothetical protein